MAVSLNFFLGLSAILFSIGLVGVLLRRSPLTILLSLEIMLNSVNLTLVAFSREVGGSDGQVFALIVMGIAAAEVVVGLGLVVAMTRREMVLDTDELRTLNG
jgi:NADH:ubiquinone oxidoreductase subunit K